jgi:SAM-dependent methyltransferase
MSRWDEVSGGAGHGSRYAQRFAALAAEGVDVHGEATLCAELVGPGARVLDAGCGTGRVAIRLAELGRQVAGVDLDPAMLEVARAQAPDLTWLLGDLAALADVLPEPATFDLVVAAGNVLPLLAPGTEDDVLAGLAAQLVPGGLLLAGFGLDPAHLPIPEAPLTLDAYDSCCARAGMERVGRWATWDRQPYDGGGYAVSLHRRA